MNYSFIMLKPDAIKRNLCEPILDYFTKNDIAFETFTLKKAEITSIESHYEEVISRFGKDFEINMIKYFLDQYVLPVIVKKEDENLIPFIRTLIGATDPSKAAKGTIRGDLGIDSYEKADRENRTCENLIHASDSAEAFAREIKIWFQKETWEKYLSK